MKSILDEIGERYDARQSVGTDWGTLMSLARLAERVAHHCGGSPQNFINGRNECVQEIRAILHPAPPAPVAPAGPWKSIPKNIADPITGEYLVIDGWISEGGFDSLSGPLAARKLNSIWQSGWLAGKGAS